jgi:hypothetical protein
MSTVSLYKHSYDKTQEGLDKYAEWQAAMAQQVIPNSGDRKLFDETMTKLDGDLSSLSGMDFRDVQVQSTANSLMRRVKSNPVWGQFSSNFKLWTQAEAVKAQLEANGKFPELYKRRYDDYVAKFKSSDGPFTPPLKAFDDDLTKEFKAFFEGYDTNLESWTDKKGYRHDATNGQWHKAQKYRSKEWLMNSDKGNDIIDNWIISNPESNISRERIADNIASLYADAYYYHKTDEDKYALMDYQAKINQEKEVEKDRAVFMDRASTETGGNVGEPTLRDSMKSAIKPGDVTLQSDIMKDALLTNEYYNGRNQTVTGTAHENLTAIISSDPKIKEYIDSLDNETDKKYANEYLKYLSHGFDTTNWWITSLFNGTGDRSGSAYKSALADIGIRLKDADMDRDDGYYVAEMGVAGHGSTRIVATPEGQSRDEALDKYENISKEIESIVSSNKDWSMNYDMVHKGFKKQQDQTFTYPGHRYSFDHSRVADGTEAKAQIDAIHRDMEQMLLAGNNSDLISFRKAGKKEFMPYADGDGNINFEPKNNGWKLMAVEMRGQGNIISMPFIEMRDNDGNTARINIDITKGVKSNMVDHIYQAMLNTAKVNRYQDGTYSAIGQDALSAAETFWVGATLGGEHRTWDSVVKSINNNATGISRKDPKDGIQKFGFKLNGKKYEYNGPRLAMVKLVEISESK